MSAQQLPISGDPDIEQAAIELWRQIKDDSADRDWDEVISVRKAAYRRIALGVLTAAGCMNGLKRAS